MTTAVDTNVIVALWDAGDTLHQAARKALDTAWNKEQLVISGVVYAELIAAPGRSEGFVDRFCEDARIRVEWELKEQVWRLAGAAYRRYAERRRKQSGAEPRRLLADFVIGAHAQESGYKLLSADAAVYRRAFPELAVEVM